MIELDKMSREELMEVIRIKDLLLMELREEVDAYRTLAEELQLKLGSKDITCTGNGD